MSRNVLLPLVELARAVEVAEARIASAAELTRQVKDAESRVAALYQECEKSGLVVRGATEKAKRLVSDAEREAAGLLEAAKEECARARSACKAEADKARAEAAAQVSKAVEERRSYEKEADSLAAHVAELLARRDALVTEVTALRSRVAAL